MCYISTWDWRGLCPLSLPRIGEDYILYLYLGLERIMSYISTWDWRGLYYVLYLYLGLERIMSYIST